MRIGISSMYFELNEKILICKELGFNHIEVGIDNLKDWDFLFEQKENLKKNDISIGIHMPMELNPCEIIKYINDYWIKFFIENYNKGKLLNVKYYNLHLGYGIRNKVEKYRKNYMNNALYFFYNILKNIKDVDINIENTYSINGDIVNIGNKVDDFNYIFKNIVSNNLGFCYDTGHYLINEDRYIEDLSERIKLIHLSDNDGKEDLHLGLCENGLLRKEDIKKLLKSKNLDYIVLEMDKNFFESSKKIILESL